MEPTGQTIDNLDTTTCSPSSNSRTGKAMTTAKQFIVASSAPIYECLVSEDMFDVGIGHVIMSRKVAEDTVAFSIFQLDVFALALQTHFYYNN